MSLRISSPGKGGQLRRGGGGDPAEADFYMSRLIKLLPAEAVAVYPLLQNNARDVITDVERTVSSAKAEMQAALQTAVEVAPDVAERASQSVPNWLPMAMAWLVLLLVIMLRWHATRDANGNPQWGAVAIAAISFFLWVPAMNGSFGVLEFATDAGLINWAPAVKDFVPEILLIFWTIMIPAFYKPEN